MGAYFLTSLYVDMEALKILFGIHPQAYRGFHRSLSNRFPFAIYDTYDPEAVMIRAVVDCRRKPSWIRRHIENA